jgi:hypothetical protein
MMSNGIRFFLRVLAAPALLLGTLALLPGAVTAPLSVAERAAGPDGAQTERLAPEQAIAVALNDLQATADGYRLRHPRHVATFTPDGLRFTPRRGGPEWAWQLTAVRVGDAPLSRVELGRVRPVHEQPGVVAYSRGGLTEQYLARQGGLEQQFVIPRPLTPGGADLVIAGTVRSAGVFAEAENGWQWRTAEGAVRLGDVRAYDATGRNLPATMQVRATETRIVVDGEALAHAAYPVTIDPQIGANDFRLSDMGPTGGANYVALSAAVAYNSTDDEYLVVWYGDDDTGALVDEEYEIYGQRVDAATGAEIGANDFRLSDMGPDGDVNYYALWPAVAYNSADNEYLVVWSGADTIGGGIFGQRVSATGAEIGANDFRLSDVGPNGHFGFSAVAYNSADNEYLVVWPGDDGTGGLVDDEFEIFGQRVNAATGTQIGTDLRLSDMGPDGDAHYDASFPAVAYNSAEDEYLVVWEGDDDTGGLVDGEDEIFGQRVDAATGTEVGTNDFRLSDMGPDGDANYGADFPAVAYNDTNNEYLVVWYGDDDTGGLVDEEYEIYGQRVSATGAEIGANDFRLSDMGPDGDTNYAGGGPAVAYNSADNDYLVVWLGADTLGVEIFGQRVNAATGAEIGTDLCLSDMGPDGDANYDAYVSAVAYNSAGNEYLVVWHGDDDTGPLVGEEFEIFGQRVVATGAEIGANDFRLSDMGPDGDAYYDAGRPAVAYNGKNNEYLVVWEGDDNTGALVDGEYEIFGQLVDAATGAEIGANDFRLSDMGPDGDANYDAGTPAVAFNSAANEYLVVWSGEDDTDPLMDGEYEIFGQRVSATGAEIGTNDFRLSDMGPDERAYYDAFSPAVAYNGAGNEYLVVWWGVDDTGSLVIEEREIFGQRVSATGTEIGANDFRLSDMGPDGHTSYGAYSPVVAYNSTEDEYLVVWEGDDDTGGLVNNEYEIFGQRVDAATGAEIGANDFRLSDMGPDGDAYYDAYSPAVAYNSAGNEYLVVWYGDDDTGGLVEGETEIFGQRVEADTGAEIGPDLRVSDMGPDGNASYNAHYPAVAYNGAGNEYLVVWSGEDDTDPLVEDEFEIFGQLVDAATMAEIGIDLRLSDMGPDGHRGYDAWDPAVAYNGAGNEYLVVWYGDDDTGGLVDDEYEIFGQRFDANYWLYLPLVLRNGQVQFHEFRIPRGGLCIHDSNE